MANTMLGLERIEDARVCQDRRQVMNTPLTDTRLCLECSGSRRSQMANTMWTCFSAEGEQSRPRDGGQLPPMRRSTLWPSQVSAHGINVLLRRTPTQTASRHSDSLPVQELVFCGQLRTGTLYLGTGGLSTQNLCQVVCMPHDANHQHSHARYNDVAKYFWFRTPMMAFGAASGRPRRST